VLGRGSTFWFTARLGKSNQKKRELLPHPDLRGRHMLVIDDNEHARLVLADMLASMSFAVDAVESGQKGIVAVRDAANAGRPYDIVFTDWQMPEMDGLAAGQQIRALGLTPSPRLVMVTAYGREEVIKGAEAVGFSDVLIKPVNPSMLFDSTMRALGEGGPGAGAPEVSAAPSRDLSVIAGARVLLVEDNELNQEVGVELLKEAGMVVEVADNGRIAIDRLTQVGAPPFDAVLMDMQMPVLDGVSATLELRRLPELAGLPIIAMTANAMQADRDRCLQAGMNGYVAKPIEPDALWQELLKWVKPRAGQASPRGAALESVTPTAQSPVDVPRHIVELDVDAGLKRVLGKKPLYVNMLRKFVAGARPSVRQMADALAADDWATAERLAHTLKGTAGSVGAMQVQADSTALETAFKEHATKDTVQPLLDRATQTLAPLLAALEAWLPPDAENSATAPAAPVDATALQQATQELAARLADDDSAAEDCWDTHAGLLRAAFAPHAQRLEEAIRNFEYDVALSVLKEAAQVRGVELS
jgi:two-component system, sensor histidine kinase and response regulator